MSTQTAALPDGTRLTKPASGEKVSLSVINTNTDNIANNIISLNNQIMPDTTITGDLNDLTTGNHYCDSTCSNLPVSGAYFFVECFKRSDNVIVQIAYKANEDKVYIRRKASGTWQNWQNIVVATETHGTNGAIKYYKSGRVVSVIIEGNITIGSGGVIGTLPEGYRPISTVYFLLSPSGSSDKTYLACISASGAIVVYNRSESFGYAYANVTFIA